MRNGFSYALRLSALLSALIIIAGCGRDQSTRDDISPSAPVWVPRYDDNAVAQQGIRAEPVTDSRNHWVRLEWYANPESDVIIYRIWRRTETDPEPRHREQIKDLALGVDLAEGQSRYAWVDQGNNPNDNTNNNLDPDLTTGDSRGYYWEVQAIDSAGNRSPTSPSIYYRLIANPSLIGVSGDSSVWTVSYQFIANSDADLPVYDMIRLYPQAYGPDSMLWANPLPQYGQFRSANLNLSAPLRHGQRYVLQINPICNRAGDLHTDSLAGAAGFTTFIYP